MLRIKNRAKARALVFSSTNPRGVTQPGVLTLELAGTLESNTRAWGSPKGCGSKIGSGSKMTPW